MSKFVSLKGNQLTVTPGNGQPDEIFTVVPAPTVTLNGHAAVLAELKPGDSLSLGGDPVTSIAASRG